MMQAARSGDMPFAVTGPAGFIGHAVCQSLLSGGGQVVGIGPGAVAPHPRLRHMPGVIDGGARLPEALAGVGTVIHAAGRGTPAAVDRFDGAVAMAEIALAAQVMEAAVQAGVRKLVLVSSGGTVYGDAGAAPAITEAAPLQPTSRYGAVKTMIEQMGLTLSRAGLLDCVVARVSNPYGPGQRNVRGQGLVATLIERLLHGQPIPVWGDGSLVRDYIYIEDAARGLVAAAGLPGGSVCNVSSGVGRSVSDVIADVSQVLGRRAVIERLPWRDGGVPRNVLSNAKLVEATGWQPLVRWPDGLRHTVEWWTADAVALEQAGAASL